MDVGESSCSIFTDLQVQSGHTYPKAAAKLIQKFQTAKYSMIFLWSTYSYFVKLSS